jgi:hypothetical protein
MKKCMGDFELERADNDDTGTTMLRDSLASTCEN